MQDQIPRPRGNPNWQPGVSGNPSGRSKGFKGVVKQIGESTRDGAELVEYALRVWRDETEPPERRDRAHAWLSDRYLGKPLSAHEIVATVATHTTVTLPPNWDQLPEAQRLTMIEARKAGLALPPGDDDGDE